MESFDKFVAAIERGNIREVERLISGGFPINEPEEDYAPILYVAIMSGNLKIIRLLLERGANPSYVAEEPMATIYNETPLELARGLRSVMDWDKYHAVAKLLVEFGAKDVNGQGDYSEEELKDIEQRSREWQARKDGLPN